MRDARRDKPSRCRAEDELEPVTGFSAYAQTPALVQDGNDRATLERAAEVDDARAGAHARDGSGRAEHRTMVVLRGSPVWDVAQDVAPLQRASSPTATLQRAMTPSPRARLGAATYTVRAYAPH
jgi:hypothetical protein